MTGFRTILAVAAIALAATTSVTHAPPTAEASHAWGGYHWARTGNPFTIKLGDNVSAGWDSYLATTASGWGASTVLDTVVVPGAAKGSCRPTAGRVEVCSGKYGQNGWLGLAQIWLSGSHITQGTVKVNDTYFALPAYNTPDERNHVMCQEVGHTLGLGHTSEDGSTQNTCMDYSTSPTSVSPNQHDYDQLAAIYGHSDTSTTVKSTPLGLTQHEYDSPGEWGRRVRGSADGRGATFERDFGGGHKLETFVIWAK